MILLVNGATVDVERHKDHPRLGVLLTPGSNNRPERAMGWGVPMAIDNGAFSGFDAPAFLSLLAKVLRSNAKVLWATAPDVVGDAKATLGKFAIWGPMMRHLGFKTALVTQDGMKAGALPWAMLDAIFVGASDEWKLGPDSVEICDVAKRLGKAIHVGRCNSKVRIRAAMAMGADSCDGSQFSWWPRRYIPKGLRWIEESEKELEAMRAQGQFAGDVPSNVLAKAKPKGGGKKAKHLWGPAKSVAAQEGLYGQLL